MHSHFVCFCAAFAASLARTEHRLDEGGKLRINERGCTLGRLVSAEDVIRDPRSPSTPPAATALASPLGCWGPPRSQHRNALPHRISIFGRCISTRNTCITHVIVGRSEKYISGRNIPREVEHYRTQQRTSGQAWLTNRIATRPVTSLSIVRCPLEISLHIYMMFACSSGVSNWRCYRELNSLVCCLTNSTICERLALVFNAFGSTCERQALNPARRMTGKSSSSGGCCIPW
eukprot:scaffold177717_cov39-Tisochrysis_lutea.AAC.2